MAVCTFLGRCSSQPQYVRKTDVAPISTTDMEPGQKKRTFLYAGIGFVGIGVVSIFMIYMFVYQPLTSETADENTEFNLEEIHRVPLARHDHVSLSLLVNGEPAVVPEGIGMNSQLWHDHSLDQYGPSGISPMHTHDTSGTIHIESTTAREYTVGEFLKVVGMDSNTVTRMTVDDDEVADFLNHEMRRGERIQLEVTTAS